MSSYQQNSRASMSMMTLAAAAAAASTEMSFIPNSTVSDSMVPGFLTFTSNVPPNTNPPNLNVTPYQQFYSQLANYNPIMNLRFVGPDFPQQLPQPNRELDFFSNLDYQKGLLYRTLDILLSDSECEPGHPIVGIYKGLLHQFHGVLPDPHLFQPIIRFDSREAFYCEMHHLPKKMPFGAQDLVEWIRYVDHEVVSLSSAIYSLLYFVYKKTLDGNVASGTGGQGGQTHDQNSSSNRGIPNYYFRQHQKAEEIEEIFVSRNSENCTSRKHKVVSVANHIPESPIASTSKSYLAHSNSVPLKERFHEFSLRFSPTPEALDSGFHKLNLPVPEFYLRNQYDVEDLTSNSEQSNKDDPDYFEPGIEFRRLIESKKASKKVS